MAKVDFQKDVEINKLKKENTTLKNKIDNFSEKIKELENSYNNSVKEDPKIIEKLPLSDIKLTTNIRDDYQYEEIEELAKDLLKNGQLQAVLITSDNYLLAGYRRYHALKLLLENPELFPGGNINTSKLVVYRHNLSIEDLGQENVEQIQLSENEQRRSIDNFQLSKLFNRYIEKGFDQKYLVEKFNKSKTFISAIVSIRYIDEILVKLLKEIQVFAWSKKKFTMVNSKIFNDKERAFYEKNRINHGWKLLYEIARQPDVKEQKRAFLKHFKFRLSPEELESEYFSEIILEEKKDENKKILALIKYTKYLANSIENIDSDLPESVIKQLRQGISQIEKTLEKLNPLNRK